MQSKKHIKVLLTILILLISGIGVMLYQHYTISSVYIHYSDNETEISASKPKAQPPQTSIKQQRSLLHVHIAGNIRKPGVYKIEKGKRILDLIHMAGGYLEYTDLDQINLVALIRDGQKILIPTKKNIKSKRSQPKVIFPISINHASSEHLQLIPGIGAKAASEILSYKRVHGSFNALKDLLHVKGIGSKTLEKISEYIYIQ